MRDKFPFLLGSLHLLAAYNLLYRHGIRNPGLLAALFYITVENLVCNIRTYISRKYPVCDSATHLQQEADQKVLASLIFTVFVRG